MKINLFLLITAVSFAFKASCANEDTLSWHYEKIKQECHDLYLTNGISHMDQIVDIRTFVPQIQVELRYAT